MVDRENLTTGSVPEKLIAFALPLLLANLFQSFYGIIDILVMGGIAGKAGLVAISNIPTAGFIISSICIGITMGGAVLIAQFEGADGVKGQSETVGTLLPLTLTASGVVTIAVLLGYKSSFDLLSIPSDAMGDICEYMEVIYRGTVFTFGYNRVCPTMEGSGGSKSPLYFVRIAAVVNIVLGPLLINPFGVGTKGAVYATIFSRSISFATVMIHLKRRGFTFDSKPEHFAIRKDKLAMILKMGLPTTAQMAVMNIPYLLITGMLNQFGVAATAASDADLEVNTFAGMPYWAMGQAVTAVAR